MKNRFILWASLYLLFACDRKQEVQDSPSGPLAFTEADVRSNWVWLTEQEGNWSIFQPCEASNFNLTFILFDD